MLTADLAWEERLAAHDVVTRSFHAAADAAGTSPRTSAYAAASSSFYIHFGAGGVTQAAKDRVEAVLGGRPLVHYVPHNAFAVEATLEEALAVENVDGALHRFVQSGRGGIGN